MRTLENTCIQNVWEKMWYIVWALNYVSRWMDTIIITFYLNFFFVTIEN